MPEAVPFIVELEGEGSQIGCHGSQVELASMVQSWSTSGQTRRWSRRNTKRLRRAGHGRRHMYAILSGWLEDREDFSRCSSRHWSARRGSERTSIRDSIRFTHVAQQMQDWWGIFAHDDRSRSHCELQTTVDSISGEAYGRRATRVAEVEGRSEGL